MSSVDGISTTTSESATNYLDRIPKQTLGQDDFLQLLVTQLTQQDPMSPKSDSEFISQMASFSSLDTADRSAGGVENSTNHSW